MRFLRKLFAVTADSLDAFVKLALQGECRESTVRLVLDISGSVLFNEATGTYALEHVAETTKGRWVIYRETLFTRNGLGISNKPSPADTLRLGLAGLSRVGDLELKFPDSTVQMLMPDGVPVTDAMRAMFGLKIAASGFIN